MKKLTSKLNKIVKKNTNVETKKEDSYDKTHQITPLKLLCVICNREQGKYYTKAFTELDVSASFEIYGRGTAPREIYELLGIGDVKKSFVFGIVNSKDLPKLKKCIQDRFNISKSAKGIAFTIPLNSIAGVILYKFFINDRKLEKKVK